MSKIEVNTVEPQCGTTLTLGASGDTVTLGSGASQSGFGRTGTVNWDTTVKTTSFTAVSGNGYFVNTTSGAITVTLPASPSAGDIVAVKDYAQTFATNNCTIGRNSSNIEGVAADVTLDGNAESVTFVYVDSTKGWLLVNESTTVYGPQFISATGGTITTCGNFKIHTFTGPGTFTVCSVGNPAGSNTVSYLVIAGGGGGGLGSGVSDRGAGGGAGGYREGKASSDCYSASPLVAPAGLPVSATGYPITVGGGGAQQGSNLTGNNGNPSTFSTITSTAGGGGGKQLTQGNAGGSGGGYGGGSGSGTPLGGAGNTPPVSPPQGNPGGRGGSPSSAPNIGGGGGGGATTAGTDAGPGGGNGNGGTGATSSINGTPTERAGGGGGDKDSPATGGGAGGSGNACTDATANTGGGGQGGYPSGGGNGTAGGSGIVIIRYKYQ